MTPIDLWPEYKEVKATPRPAASQGVPSKFTTLTDAKKKLAPVDYAISLLVAFAAQWEEDVEHHSRQGANNTIQEAALRVLQLPQHEELTKTLQTLITRLRREHPQRDPLFLKSTKEITSATESWEAVRSLFNNLKNLQGAYPEEVKIEQLLQNLIAKVNQYIKEGDFKKGAEQRDYHGIFQAKTKLLVDLIRSFEGNNEKQFRVKYFPQSLEEDKEEHGDFFQESAALWKRMWDVAKQSHYDPTFFEWLKKRGETHEES